MNLNRTVRWCVAVVLIVAGLASAGITIWAAFQGFMGLLTAFQGLACTGWLLVKGIVLFDQLRDDSRLRQTL